MQIDLIVDSPPATWTDPPNKQDSLAAERKLWKLHTAEGFAGELDSMSPAEGFCPYPTQ